MNDHGRTVSSCPGRVIGPLRWIAASLAIAGLAAAGIARQPGAADTPLEGFAARSLQRIATMDLRDTPRPEVIDYQIAAILLGFAQDLAPDNQELIRRRMEAAWRAGDQDLVVELTRQLIKLDPKDTTSQLRLISSRIAALQTAEERLAAYDDLLGPRGQSLDAAIRSRLALDSALLLREKGDDAGFIARLKMATQLDASNKDAAALTAAYFATRVNNPIGRLDLMANVLLADPVDPNLHLAIARELASRGAVVGARRFHRNAIGIMTVAGDVPDPIRTEGLILDWLTDGPQTVVEILDRDLLMGKDQASRAWRAAERDRRSTEGLRKPEDVKLPLLYNRLRAIAAFAAGDELKAQAVAAEIDGEAAEAVAQLRDPTKWQGASEDQVKLGVYTTVADVLATRLWVKGGVEGVGQLLGEQSPMRTDLLRLMPELEGWHMLRTGDAEGALAVLEPLATKSRLAQTGVAAAYEELGRMQDAERIYRQMVANGPLTLYAAWATTRLAAVLNETRPHGDPTAFERWTSTVPSWIDRLVTEPHMFVRLSAQVTRTSVEPTEPSGVRLTLQNISAIPLAIGADRPINSRVLLAPKLDRTVAGREIIARPEVVDMERRIRLAPGEQLSVTVWPDSGITGWVLESASAQSIRTRWRAVHGFKFSPAGGFKPGVLCTETETGSLVRRPLLEAGLPPKELASKFSYDPEAFLPRAAVALRTALIFARPGEGQADWSPAVKAAAERYPVLSPATRAMLLLTLPHATLVPEMRPFDDAARSETDPLVLAVFLVTRVTDPSDEVLSRAAQSDDPRARSLADLVAARLKRGGRVYAKVTRETLLAVPAPAQASASEEP